MRIYPMKCPFHGNIKFIKENIMEYHVLFGVDGKSIQFQGVDGIVNPIDVLSNGRIVKKSTTTTRKNKNDPALNYVYESVDVVFIPD
jgi:hypothetical protein